MNKWIAIPVIAVLAVAVIVGGYFLWQQTTKLGEARSEIATLEGNVVTLEGNVSTLEGKLTASEAEVSSLKGKLTASEAEVSSLKGKLTASEAEVSSLKGKLAQSDATVATLQTDLKTANSEIGKLQADVSTQRTINSALSVELKKVKDPRHFSSLTELTDWLYKDDTNTKYKDERPQQKAYILQVRALRDGYLLGAIVDTDLGGNIAIIGDSIYVVNPADDTSYRYHPIQPLPSHPLSLE